MNQKESDFTAKLLATFRIEAEEHLKALSDGLTLLENPLEKEKRHEYVSSIYREVHSLKGAARSVGHDALQGICQAMENVLSAWKQEKIPPSSMLFDLFYAAIDFIAKLVLNPPKALQGEDGIVYLSLIQQLDNLIQATNTKEQKNAPESPPKKFEKSTFPVSETVISDQTIRISVKKLDHLLQQVEEMIAIKLTVHQQMDELKRMQAILGSLEKEWESLQAEVRSLDYEKREIAMQEWQYQCTKFIKKGINRLAHTATQDYRFVGNMVDALLEDTKQVLLQPFSTILDALPRMTRDLSHTLGKEVRLQFKGGDIELDRRILEAMKDPLIHLVRNAIDHGIETAEARIQKNKPSYGNISVAISQIGGNKIELEISDDGQGIDVDQLKNAVLKQGNVTSQEISQMTEQEVLMLFFHSGISTSATVTEVSGRGLGMSIVTEKVEKLGGHLSVDSKAGKGTTITIELPLTLSTFRGIHIAVSGHDFIMPTRYVKKVLKVPLQDIKTLENNMTINIDGRLLPFVKLDRILGLIREDAIHDTRAQSVLVIKASEKSIAFGVDQVFNEQEILVKGLGKQLVHVRNILAATVMEWGKVVPILNPLDLIKSATRDA